MAPNYWLEQLHKSLFDRESIQDLLKRAGFKCYAVFNYAIPGEELPVNLGFVAWKNKPDDLMASLTSTIFNFGASFSNAKEVFAPEYLTIVTN